MNTRLCQGGVKLSIDFGRMPSPSPRLCRLYASFVHSMVIAEAAPQTTSDMMPAIAVRHKTQQFAHWTSSALLWLKASSDAFWQRETSVVQC